MQIYLLALIRILGLLLVLTLERVIGLPLLFGLFGLVWLDKNKDSVYQYPVQLLILSFMMSVVYDVMWPASFIWWLGSRLLVDASSDLIKNKKRRFLIVMLLMNLLVMWWVQLKVGYIMLAQLLISYVLIVLWMRVFKFKRQSITISNP
jgi:hypothetical protein